MILSYSQRNVSESLEVSRGVATALMVGCFLCFAYGSARSLTGGRDVGLDDIGARASVALYYEGKPICGGVVYKDRYILTTAHCFTDGKGNLEIEPDDIEVLYWSSGKARRDVRTVEEIVIHENYLFQEAETARLLDKAWNFDNFPVNHEDIAVMKLSAPHPAGTISAFVSGIDNEYTSRDGKDTWFYMYGSSVNGISGRLQRALIGQYGALDRVVPGRKPDPFYTVRQMTIIPSENGFDKNVSQCHGDSGSGVFLIASEGVSYEEKPDKLPEGIQLKEGLPVVVGLVEGHPITDISQMDARCGRDVKAVGFRATRIDYYHDWILSTINDMK